jgi:5-methylcytosine-specific restriction endonuclease McrA
MPSFVQNKYTKWYFNIISNAQNRDASGYTEKHHIIPKSLGGNNDTENLVKLTGREHFICHWLLTKMVSNTKQKYQMWNAFSCMLYRALPGAARYKVTGRVFENIKKEGAKIKSIKFSGSGNPMHGIIRSEESKKKQSDSAKGRLVLESTREKLRNNMLGKLKTESHKNSLKQSWAENKEARSGKNHPGYGKLLDDNTKEKIRQAVLNMPLHTCEHCGKTTTKGNYKRWHSNNCKVILGVI